MGNLRSVIILIRQDITVAMGNPSDWLNPLLFFIIVCALFPIALGNDPQLLAKIAPGIICVAALLACLLALDNLFRQDYREGVLEQLLISSRPLSLLIFAKLIAHWLLTGLPLIILIPLVGMMLQLPSQLWLWLMLSLTLATPILSLIGSINGALTISLPQRGILLALLVLPLVVPVLIFAVGIVIAKGQGIPVNSEIALLAAMLIVTVAIGPWVCAKALRVGVM